MEYKINRLDPVTFSIDLIINGLVIGFLKFSKTFGENLFENFCSYEDFTNLFPEGKYLIIEEVWIDRKYRGKGLGNKLLNYFDNFVQRKLNDFTRIVLYALPMDIGTGLPLNILKKFYGKFGFEDLKFKNLQTYNPNIYKKYRNNYMIKFL